MVTVARNFEMPELPSDPKVVDLSSYKKKHDDDQPVKLNDYVPCGQDITAFLRVLRYLQNKTHSEQVEVEANADGITLSLTDVISSGDLDHDEDTIDYQTISHKLFVSFPFMLMDIDASELTVYEDGRNTIDMFSESMVHTILQMKAGAK